MNAPLVERCQDRIAGVLTCYDRAVITCTLPGACHAAGMTSFLTAQTIRIDDYPRFAEPLRDRLRANAEKLAESAGAKIEHIAGHIFARRMPSRRSSRLVAIIPDWCMIFRSGNPVRLISLGTTSAPGKPTCARRQASVCTSTFISSTPSWGWSICAYRPGTRSDSSSTATAIAGWHRC